MSLRSTPGSSAFTTISPSVSKISTAGLHVVVAAGSSCRQPRPASSKSRFILSCRDPRSRKGSHRLIAMSASSKLSHNPTYDLSGYLSILWNDFYDKAFKVKGFRDRKENRM